MLKKILLLTAALLFVTAGTAAAQDAYPPAGNGATVTITRAEPGQPITIRVQVFAPGTTVDFTLFSAPVHLGSAVADANGVATLTFTVPENTAPGTHTIEATGIGADGRPLTVRQTITVVADGAGTGS
ncbi:MAG TPA: hypothetical protein VFV32_15535, partial [Acidimicrobiales bacterium]|nr:hypothetical protein [Acidimicrobiales bacterium]